MAAVVSAVAPTWGSELRRGCRWRDGRLAHRRGGSPSPRGCQCEGGRSPRGVIPTGVDYPSGNGTSSGITSTGAMRLAAPERGVAGTACRLPCADACTMQGWSGDHALPADALTAGETRGPSRHRLGLRDPGRGRLRRQPACSVPDPGRRASLPHVRRVQRQRQQHPAWHVLAPSPGGPGNRVAPQRASGAPGAVRQCDVRSRATAPPAGSGCSRHDDHPGRQCARPP